MPEKSGFLHWKIEPFFGSSPSNTLLVDRIFTNKINTERQCNSVEKPITQWNFWYGSVYDSKVYYHSYVNWLIWEKLWLDYNVNARKL